MNALENNWDIIYDAINNNIECEDPNDDIRGIDEAANEIINKLSRLGGFIQVDNLYDLSKFEILQVLMEKCNLQTLEQIADIYSKGTLDYDKVPQPSIGMSLWKQNKTVSGL